jgi:hypothetical protein
MENLPEDTFYHLFINASNRDNMITNYIKDPPSIEDSINNLHQIENA